MSNERAWELHIVIFLHFTLQVMRLTDISNAAYINWDRIVSWTIFFALNFSYDEINVQLIKMDVNKETNE